MQTKKCKSNPETGLGGLEGSGRLRLLDFYTIGTLRWYGCQPYAPAVFTPRNILVLNRPQANGVVGCLRKKPSDMTGDRSGDLPTSSAAP
jgi:hypothetical protein